MAKMWEFDAFIEEGDEDFASYVERFGHYCKVAGVQDEELKKSAFISAIGKKRTRRLRTFFYLQNLKRRRSRTW